MNALIDSLLRGLAWAICVVFHDIDIVGAENLPATGAVIVAGNHPSYLDPIYISLGLKRPVRFLAWEKPFQIPILGDLIRRYGAIPVNTDRPGRASFESAVKVLREGEVFGIFPEGGRSDFGVMNPFKSGVARLALMTGAPIVPVTVRGAFRVWPKYQLFPRPGYVKVIFHEPIRVDLEAKRDREYEKKVVDRVMEAINASLLPGLRAEMKEESIYFNARVPWTWTSDFIPYLFMVAVGAAARVRGTMVPPWVVFWMAGFTMYLAADALFNPPGAWAKGLRQRMPWFLLGLMAVHESRFSAPSIAAWVAGYLVLAWYSSFRFQSFKRWRGPALLALYAAYVVHLLRSLL